MGSPVYFACVLFYKYMFIGLVEHNHFIDSLNEDVNKMLFPFFSEFKIKTLKTFIFIWKTMEDMKARKAEWLYVYFQFFSTKN